MHEVKNSTGYSSSFAHDRTGEKYVVLIADDDRLNLQLTNDALKLLGCHVEAVSDGRAAVEALIHRRFDLAFMAVQMPRLDGLHATRRVRRAEGSSGRRLPIIALTAGGSPDELLACTQAGMDDVLVKPFPLAAMRDMLRKWCRSQQNAEQWSVACCAGK
jgi:CheY-like chemotaxis protein